MLLKEAIRLFKTKVIKKMVRKKLIVIGQSQIYMVFGCTNLEHCVTQVNVTETERTRVEVLASFYYSIDPLNLSDFKMNLIANSNKLQFSWKFNALLP